MEDWMLGTLFLFHCFFPGQPYLSTNATIEKVVTGRSITFDSVNNDTTTPTIEVQQIKKPFKPSKQLFSKIFNRPKEIIGRHKKYNRMYENPSLVTSTPEMQVQIEAAKSHGFPKRVIGGNTQQITEIYKEPEDIMDQSVSQSITTYDEPIHYFLNNQPITGNLNHKKQKEIHYHKHKHLHEHDHKQGHIHKHRQEHIHDHMHSHLNDNNHNHFHLGQHNHLHQDENHHSYEGSPRITHNHGHWHQKKHGHRGKHSNDHNHSHDHNHREENYHSHYEHEHEHEPDVYHRDPYYKHIHKHEAPHRHQIYRENHHV